jgi:hypothetical protein
MTWPAPSGNWSGSAPRSHEASNCWPVDHELPTYWTETRSPALAALPLPLTMSFVYSSAGGSPDGCATAGFSVRSSLIVPTSGSPAGAGSGVASAVAAGGEDAGSSSSPQEAANRTSGRQARTIVRRLMRGQDTSRSSSRTSRSPAG